VAPALNATHHQETNMSKTEISLITLLERLESEFETADGRTVRLCRDPNGNYWAVDGAERVVSLNEFAGECRSVARAFCARERAQMFGRFVGSVKQAVARAAKAWRSDAKPAHA
jgi:hypothetical protein